MAKRAPREDDDIEDTTVVYRIAFASHKKEAATCPYTLTRAEAHSLGLSGDLNKGKGGEYIYLCIGKKRISELSGEENFNNKIHLNTNQEDCGKLHAIKSTLQSSFFFSNQITLCVGYDKNEKPWNNIKVFNRDDDKRGVPETCRLEITEGKFL